VQPPVKVTNAEIITFVPFALSSKGYNCWGKCSLSCD
jgi:hypothetical protein